MKQLVCEMCGSSELIKQDGVFVCQNCGTKYSVEEAKKMMIEGTVRVDNTHLIENYLEMANRAYQSANNSEAEAYCNKVIEIDPNNYQALMLKGKTAGWQSSLQNNRFAEAINCFASAIENAPETEKEDLLEDAKTQINNLSCALMSLQADRFAKWPDEEETSGLINVVGEIYKAEIQFIHTIGDAVDNDELMAPIATLMNNAAMTAWNSKIVPEYRNDSDGHPDDYAFKELISRAEFCTTIIEQAIKLSNEDDEADISRYENLIWIHNYVINSCSYEYKTVMTGYSVWDGSEMYDNRYVKSLELNDYAKSHRRSLISDYRTKINNIKSDKAKKMAEEQAEKERIAREERQKRIDAYWEEHADEKELLEAELKDLEGQIDSLSVILNNQEAEKESKISSISGTEEIVKLDELIKRLTAEKNNLGIFKGKEKKSLQDQIDQTIAEKKEIQKKVTAETRAIDAEMTIAITNTKVKINSIQDRVDEITSKLTNPLNS